MGQQADGGAGKGTGTVPGLARRLPVYQGARRAGPARQRRDRARDHRASVDHRVGPGRPGPAGSVASAWPSRSSSPTPGGCCGSSPGCPKGSSMSSPWIWWWPPSSPWPARHCSTEARRVPRGFRVRNPLRYGRLVELVRSWFTEHPLGDSAGPAHQRARMVVPRTSTGAAPVAPGDPGPGHGGEGDAQPPPPRQAGRALRSSSSSARTRPRAPSPTWSCTAPTPRPRPSSRWTA